MARHKIHKLKAITLYEDYISTCGKTVHQHTTTTDNSLVTCANCKRMIDHAKESVRVRF